MNSPATPPPPRRARQRRDELALAAGAGALAARQLHALWVASNTTGAPLSRMMTRLLMSDTRLW